MKFVFFCRNHDGRISKNKKSVARRHLLPKRGGCCSGRNKSTAKNERRRLGRDWPGTGSKWTASAGKFDTWMHHHGSHCVRTKCRSGEQPLHLWNIQANGRHWLEPAHFPVKSQSKWMARANDLSDTSRFCWCCQLPKQTPCDCDAVIPRTFRPEDSIHSAEHPIIGPEIFIRN